MPADGATHAGDRAASSARTGPDPAPARPSIGTWTLYPPDGEVVAPVRPRAPGTWRQAADEPPGTSATIVTPRRGTSAALRLLRTVLVLAILVVLLVAAGYLLLGHRGPLGSRADTVSIASTAPSIGQAATSPAASAGAGSVASAAPAASVVASAPVPQPSPPTPPPSPRAAPSGSPRTTSVVHVVRSGETLDGIAAAYHVTVDQIVAANHLKDPNIIIPGERLVIPPP